MTEKNKGGRPPKPPAERMQRKTVTLPPRHIDAIALLARDDEDFSTTLQRLLDSHPALATISIKEAPVSNSQRGAVKMTWTDGASGLCKLEYDDDGEPRNVPVDLDDVCEEYRPRSA